MCKKRTQQKGRSFIPAKEYLFFFFLWESVHFFLKKDCMQEKTINLPLWPNITTIFYLRHWKHLCGDFRNTNLKNVPSWTEGQKTASLDLAYFESSVINYTQSLTLPKQTAEQWLKLRGQLESIFWGILLIGNFIKNYLRGLSFKWGIPM